MKKKLEGRLEIKEGKISDARDPSKYIDLVTERGIYRIYSNSFLEKLLKSKAELKIEAEVYCNFLDLFTGKRKLEGVIIREDKHYQIKFEKKKYGEAYQLIDFRILRFNA